MEVSHTLIHTLNRQSKAAVSQERLPVFIGFRLKKESEKEKTRQSSAGSLVVLKDTQ